jgi:hypothetical protein
MLGAGSCLQVGKTLLAPIGHMHAPSDVSDD